MSNPVEQALARIRSLGDVSQLLSLKLPVTPKKNNAHIHLPPNFSAFDTVSHAINLAAEQGVQVLGASNYFDYDVYGDFAALAFERGIFPLFGLEIIALIDPLVREGVKINDPGNPGKIYICGKGITRFAAMSSDAQRLLGIIRRNDSQRIREMISKVEEVFAKHGVATGLNEAKVIDRIVARHGGARERVYLQERHVCQAFQERFFELVPAPDRAAKLGEIFGAPVKIDASDAVKVQNEIRSHLMKSGKPAFVQEMFVNFDEAKRLILELGGIPCYPTLADGAKPICPFEDPAETLVEKIKSMGLHCAELIPIRNNPQVLTQYVTAMRSAGLVITGGTEHNTLDLLPIEPQCVGGKEVPEQIRRIFWEGACVVAAHQFLSLNGECGFVDSGGNPNPRYKTAEDRIAAFAHLGEAVIAQYHDLARKRAL